jgi:hypothetical protein
MTSCTWATRCAKSADRIDGAMWRSVSGTQISRSIDAEQALQDRIAVLDIRTIVECSPQSGHSEHSSKRCRQYTQR